MNMNDMSAVTERGEAGNCDGCGMPGKPCTCDAMDKTHEDCNCDKIQQHSGAPPTGEEGKASREAMNEGTRSYGRPPSF
jgi:hypothetical protein